MNKEIQVRRRVQNIYNRREEDFPNLRAYNDYLEEVEDIIFNLIEGVDVAVTEEKIARYQEENAEAIVASRARRAEEEAAALRTEQGFGARSTTEPATIEPVNAAVSSSMPPAGQYAPAMFLPPRPTGQPVPLGAPSYNANGEPEDEETKRIREERGLRAGGWTMELNRRRTMEEAFLSIWVS